MGKVVKERKFLLIFTLMVLYLFIGVGLIMILGKLNELNYLLIIPFYLSISYFSWESAKLLK